MDKNKRKNLRGKYSQKLLDHAKESASNALKNALKQAIKKTAKATSDFIANKIADKTTKVSKILPQNNLETVTNEEKNIGVDREIPRERYISPVKGQEIINDLRLI